MIQDGSAIYPGSFDPFTNGHYGILKQAQPLFHKITLAVATNPEKTNSMFSLDNRLAFLRDVAGCHDNLKVGHYPIKGPGALYTVDYAVSIGAKYLIRGLRNNSDFEAEFAMAHINLGINPKIHTVFFMADPKLSSVSSSMVRGLIGPKGWPNAIKEYIPMPMWNRFINLI